MKKLIFLLMLSLFVLMGCSKEDSISEPVSVTEEVDLRSSPQTRPFSAGALVTTEQLAEGVFTGFCDNQFGNLNLVNTGTDDPNIFAAYLGRVAHVSSEACVRPYLQDDPEVFPPEIYGDLLPFLELFPIPGVVIQTSIWVGQNGVDELHLTMTFYTSPNPSNKFQSLLEGTFEITGGAGRFEHASGGGTVTGTTSANFLAPIMPYIRQFEGEITF